MANEKNVLVIRALVGKHGALYRQSDESNISVTKKDGKIFYLPISDIQKIVEVMDLDENIKRLSTELEDRLK